MLAQGAEPLKPHENSSASTGRISTGFDPSIAHESLGPPCPLRSADLGASSMLAQGAEPPETPRKPRDVPPGGSVLGSTPVSPTSPWAPHVR